MYAYMYNPMQSLALFRNIFEFCTFFPKFSNILVLFEKLHKCQLCRIDPEYTN